MSTRYPVPQPLRPRMGLPGAWNTPLTTQAAGISGSASITLDAVTLSSAATLAIAGAASKTLDNVTLSSAATLAIAGAAAITLGDTTLSGAGAIALSGAASITLDAVTLASEGVLSAPGTGQASITLADATLSAAGTLALASAAAVALDNLIASSSAAVALSGAAAITLGEVTLEAAGQASGPVSGEAAITFDDVTLQAEGGTRRGGRRKRVRDGLGEARLMFTRGQAAITLDAVSVSATVVLSAPAAPEEEPLPAIQVSVEILLEGISARARGEGAALVNGLKRTTVPNGEVLKRLANIERMLANQKATQ
jgi:hypothetical protein